MLDRLRELLTVGEVELERHCVGVGERERVPEPVRVGEPVAEGQKLPVRVPERVCEAHLEMVGESVPDLLPLVEAVRQRLAEVHRLWLGDFESEGLDV